MFEIDIVQYVAKRVCFCLGCIVNLQSWRLYIVCGRILRSTKVPF
jgi:hypothetical protein